MDFVQEWNQQNNQWLWKKDHFLNNLSELITGIKVLSLDVFDTLLLRTCEKPVDVFYELGEQAKRTNLIRAGLTAKEFQEIRILAERKARSNKKNASGTDEVNLKEIYEMLPQNVGDTWKLMDLEIEIEKKLCYINPHIVSLISYAKGNGTKIALLSDMYLSAEQIRSLLISSGMDVSVIDCLFVSSEEGGSKIKGTLYQKLLGFFSDEKAESILHIGDNADADVQGASASGIKSLHYKVIPSNFEGVFEWEKMRHHSILPQIQSLRKLAGAASAEYDSDDKFWYRFGAEILGPFLTAFCDWVLDICIKEQRTAIFPFMREGILLSKLLKIAIQERKLNLRVEPLYVSREATYLAGVDLFDQDFFNHLFERNHFTVSDLFRMLHLDDDLDVQGYSKYGHLTLKETASTPYSDQVTLKQRLVSFLLEEKIQNKICKTIENKRYLLVEYLKQTCSSFDRIMTVDLGFKGTIQKSIESALEKTKIHFDICHVLAIGGEETKHHLLSGMDIRGFVGNSGENQDLIRAIMRSPEFLEELLMGDVGSTLGYMQSSGFIEPILGDLKYGPDEIRKKTVCQQGVLAFQAYWYRLLEGKTGLKEQLYKDCRQFAKMIHRVIDMPTSEEAENLGNLTHDDNFGSEHASRICEDKDLELLNQLGIERFLELGQFGFKASEVYWPQGIVTRKDPAFIFQQNLKQNSSSSYLFMMSHLVAMIRQANINQIMIYGAGEVGQSLLKLARLNQIKVTCFIDRKMSLWGQLIDGVEVIPLKEAVDRGFSDVYAVGSLSFIEDIVADIEAQYQCTDGSPRIFSLGLGKEMKG
ncbi:HAD family hydrolase [Paenibacillus hamazuiensis]|uniref:HAD family hydrolase n=1 Tax=Paenibacillus hamazuiensis TaxID=2936508 RepID=UPI00200E3D55|nr:HAD family hydrolase [Paenibacillus hamazuiensis]